MKKLAFLLLLCFCLDVTSTVAQNVGISPNGSTPDASAGLDVNFTDKGLLIPRVSLVSTTSASPVAIPAVSLLVYNLATVNDVTPGYYFWNGTAWTRLGAKVNGTGTTNYLPKWKTADTLVSSQVFDNGTNVGIGTAAPGAKLEVAGRISQTATGKSVFFGETAGAVDDLTDNYNAFVGYKSGAANTSGDRNSAFGSYSLYTNKTGTDNTAIGNYALIYNTGGLNTASGSFALFLNSSGSNNTAIGHRALNNNTTGNQNTATGASSLYNSNGYNNTAYGFMSMNSTTGGWYNTAVGSTSMYTNTNGSNNTAIGYYADVQSNTLQNATAIGSRAAVGASDCLVLGSINGVNGASQSVNVGIGTTTPTARLHVVGTVKIADGTQGVKKVLTSDASGLASWQNTEFTDLISTQPIGCVHVAGYAGTGSGPWNAVVSGNYCYVVNYYAKTLGIYNVSNPESPILVGSISTGNYPRGLAVSGNYAYVTNTVGNTMTIYNISNPASPNLVGTVSTGNLPQSVAVSGNYAYVVNMVSNTLTIYNVSNPASPVQVGSAATGLEPECITVLGNYAYVVNCSSNTMQIFNVSNASSPVLAGFANTDSYPNGIAVSGNYAYVVNSTSNTLTIYNITNPSGPTLVGSANTGSYPTKVAVSGNYAFVSNYYSDAISIIDIRNPASPTPADTVSTWSKPVAVAVLNNFAYVVCHVSNVVQIIQVKCPQINIEVQNNNVVLSNPAWVSNSNNISSVNSGNVGIGTINPSAKLDVNGSVKINDGTQGANKVLTSDANGLASWQTITLPPEGWTLTGNSGTVPGTNFIGTTDSVDFDIRTDNMTKLRITTKGVLVPMNTGSSVFIGDGAGANDNLANRQNAFIGTGAGYGNTSGFYNTALGTNAMSANSTGIMNTAAGSFAMALNSTGNYNTAHGVSALYNNSIGNSNVSTGNNSLWNNSTGSNNTANGFNSLFSNTTGNFNTAIGDSSDVASNNLTNATAIGAHALVGASNSLVLGSIAGVNYATASVNVGIGTTTPAARLDVVGPVKITDGTQGANKVLTSDANGLASWQTLSVSSSGWSLTGNAGTINGTNFIGTIDNNGLDFRTNNILRIRISTKGAIETYNTGNSVFIGEGAGANSNLNDRRNIFIGYKAGYQNTSGMMNTAIGIESLYANLSSNLNTAYGAYTLHANSDGWGNTAVGYETLYSNSSGEYNTAVGRATMYYNNTGSHNSAFGMSALSSNTDGSENTAIGDYALNGNSGGHYNTALGFDALVYHYSGDGNTAIGAEALTYNNTGQYNSALGYGATVGVDGLINTTAIGANAMVNSSNSIVLGSIDGVNNANASVNVGIGTTTPGERLDVSGGNIRTSQQLISTLATGTAPLSVASTTLVSNLNADLLDGQHASAFASATGSSGYIQNQTATDQTAGFRITGNGIFNGGKIGIGTSSPTGNLQIDKTGDVTVILNADTDNAGGEEDNPRIELHQDGGSVVGAIGLTGSNEALHTGDIQNAFYLVEEYSEGAVQFGTNNIIRMTILPNGYVGIGTNAPKVPLHVAIATSSTPFSSTSVTYNRLTPTLSQPNQTGGLNGVNAVVSLIAEGDIVCKGTLTVASAIYLSSDKRLKDISGISNSLQDLDILKKIQVTDYMMKDRVTWGYASHKKVIAQQVEEVYPLAVTKTKGYIPDIYEFASKVEKTEGGYLVTMEKPVNCKQGDKIRLELENKGTVEADILKVLNDKQFEVATESNISTGELFVYGLQVDDLRTVDYDAISMLNVSATQELAKQLQEAQARIRELESQISEIRQYIEMKAER